jgi:hypothetical protein
MREIASSRWFLDRGVHRIVVSKECQHVDLCTDKRIRKCLPTKFPAAHFSKFSTILSKRMLDFCDGTWYPPILVILINQPESEFCPHNEQRSVSDDKDSSCN